MWDGTAPRAGRGENNTVKLTEAQRRCLAGFSPSGNWEFRGSMGYSTRIALINKGLLEMKRDGWTGRFIFRRKIQHETAAPPSTKP